MVAFQNFSSRTHNIPCIMRQSRIAARHCSGTRNGQGLAGNVERPRDASFLKRISSCSVKPEFESTVDNWTCSSGIPLLNSSIAACLARSVSSRKVHKRVLATDINAERGLITCVWSRIGQMARGSTPKRSRARVQSDSIQQYRRRCRRRLERIKKQRTQEHPGVTWCADGMTLERHTESLKHLERLHVHWMICAKCGTAQGVRETKPGIKCKLGRRRD